MSAEGLPLGVVRAQFDAPVPAGAAHKAPEQRKSWRWMEGLRDCAELAARCPDTRVVGVMDREADIFELFEHQRQDPRVELLVRAKNNRRIAGEHKLFERLRAAPERARLHIAVGRQSARPKTSKQKLKTKRKERLAEVSLHYERIELTPSASEFKDREPLALWCVHVREDHPPDNAKALEWFLLTTLPVQSREDAERMLRWYALRWRIEDWHRVIKSGCRVERLAHDRVERLARAIAMRLVIALAHHAHDVARARGPGAACTATLQRRRTRGAHRLRANAHPQVAPAHNHRRDGQAGRHHGRLHGAQQRWPARSSGDVVGYGQTCEHVRGLPAASGGVMNSLQSRALRLVGNGQG